VSTPHLVVHTTRRADNGAGRYGLVVSKKVGGAVVRNRARRQTRAAIELAGGIPPGVDSVIVVKPGSTLKVQELSRQIWKIMEGMGAGSAPKGASDG
jgi:ribonuclease P protein component